MRFEKLQVYENDLGAEQHKVQTSKIFLLVFYSMLLLGMGYIALELINGMVLEFSFNGVSLGLPVPAPLSWIFVVVCTISMVYLLFHSIKSKKRAIFCEYGVKLEHANLPYWKMERVNWKIENERVFLIFDSEGSSFVQQLDGLSKKDRNFIDEINKFICSDKKEVLF